MRTDTIFDLASVSKLFTSIAVAQLVEEGHVCLESPVAAHLPEFAANGKEAVTVRQLLTHTSGYPPELPLWSAWPDQASRIEAVLDHPLADPAGSTYRYSDLNLITLGVLVERLRGSHSTSSCTGASPRPWGWRTPATTRPTGHARPRPSTRPPHPAAWCAARSTTRTRGPSAASPGTRASSRRRRPGDPVAGAARRRRLPRPPDPRSLERRAARHRLQPGLRRRLARARLRARPALVHGRPLRPPHRGPHRLHRHIDRHRLRQPLLRDPADQPRAPFSRLGLGQHRSPRVGPRPGQRPTDPTAGGRTSWCAGSPTRRPPP